MAKTLLVTRSSHDLLNHYLLAYSAKIVEEAKARGWRIELAENEQDSKSIVHSRLKNKPALVFFNGHGSDSAVYGHGDEVILEEKDAGLLARTITFIRACSSLNVLGKAAVSKGAKAVAGYRGLFWLPRVNEYQSKPLQDPSAKPVLESSNAVPLALVKGATTGEALESAQKRAYGYISKMLVSEEPYDAPALRALVNNTLLLGFEGDVEASATIS